MIPPKKFEKLSKDEQLDYASKELNRHYTAYELWKKIRQKVMKGEKVEIVEDLRPDEIHLKH